MKKIVSLLFILFFALEAYAVEGGYNDNQNITQEEKDINNKNVMHVTFTEKNGSGWSKLFPMQIVKRNGVIFTAFIYIKGTKKAPDRNSETKAFMTKEGVNYVYEIRANPTADIKEAVIMPDTDINFFDHYNVNSVQFLTKNKAENSQWRYTAMDLAKFLGSKIINDLSFKNMKRDSYYSFIIEFTPIAEDGQKKK